VKDIELKRSFVESNRMLSCVLQVIPLASQTFSKSYLNLPEGHSPLFVDHADGCRFWDVDGNEFIDFSSGLASIMLGYRFEAVDRAVREQIDVGVNFSLAHPLEYEVAKLLVDMIPCAEMIRFGKTGTDATSAAIRLARHVTGRKRVALCGYHGWQDWSIGVTTMNSGIPSEVSALSDSFGYNDIESLESLFAKHKNEYAAVILEPMTSVWPQNNFLENVQFLTQKHGALLIFDEIVTGFRFSLGGAQEFFQVYPDLAVFGKGIANGYPISVLAGNADIMKHVTEIFFSGTFGGETLSLVAAKVTLETLRDRPVIQDNIAKGVWLSKQINSNVALADLSSVISISGHPSWQSWQISDHEFASQSEIRTFLIKRLVASGIFLTGNHNLSFAHQQDDLDRLVEVYMATFLELAELLNSRTPLVEVLECPIISPVFRVR